MNEPKKLTCKDVVYHVCDSIGEKWDSPKCREIREHLEKCECCKTYFKNVDSTIEFYRRYNVDVSEDVHSRLWKKLNLEDPDC